MLFQQKLAAEKRRDLRSILGSGQPLLFPGAMSPLVAMAIEKHSFDGVYISGAVIAADLGMPDIGLTNQAEVVQRGQQIARVTSLPAIIDIDTGFGEPMSVARTIQLLEEAGLCGAHLEDQINPKRCGHLDNKNLVGTAEMVRKIKAAAESRRDKNFLVIARTDARGVEGLDAAIRRAKAYLEAGADMIFAEALESLEEFAAFKAAIAAPMLVNMTEFGKSELFTVNELEKVGADIIIYPVTTLRLAMGAVERGLARIKSSGTQASVTSEMQHRRDLYSLLRYQEYNHYDQSLYNFKIQGDE